MRYAHLLEKYIQKSGLNITQITEQLKDLGIKIDRSYVSKLKSGAIPPASEDFSRAIAKITGGDPEALVNASVFERAPEVIKEFITKVEEQLWSTIDYIICNSEVKQLHDLITHIKRAHLHPAHIQILNLDEKENLNISSIIRRFNLFLESIKESLSLSDKLRLFFEINDYFRTFNEIPINLLHTKYIHRENTQLVSEDIQNPNLNMISSSDKRVPLAEDEVDFLFRCLEVYKIQKDKWF
ncbi:hypothetical protein KDC22_11530 [Paenibacillus tritici]|uniref:hypothetical protein n=1 Tax=Paenibacillus tritici TaxID=1873425 RepID=UPI001BA66DFF|nr:hypothetical protein [Paenibacillus tritici]QUL57042.1 hypothetical protein KDC22_11530 [Paenibacillus tritici]